MAKSKKPKSGTRGARKRRGTGEDMTEKSANAVEMRAPVQDDFQLPAPDDYQYHKKQILGYLDQKTSAHSRYQNAIKTAKKAGIDTDAMLAANTLKRENDPAKALRKFKQLAFSMEQEGLPIAITVHDTLAGDVQEQAYERGLADAHGGKSSNNPYPEKSDLSEKYARGFGHGTADNMQMPREEYDRANQGHEEVDDDQHVEGAETPDNVRSLADHRNEEMAHA